MQTNNYIDLFNQFINKDDGYTSTSIKDDLNLAFPSVIEIMFNDPLTSVLKKATITSEVTNVVIEDV